jgi:hypothetical protein
MARKRLVLQQLGSVRKTYSVYKHSSENAQNVDKEEVDFLVGKEQKIADYYSRRFLDYMSFNAASKFPEYYTNSNDDVWPEKDSYFSSWVL